MRIRYGLVAVTALSSLVLVGCNQPTVTGTPQQGGATQQSGAAKPADEKKDEKKDEEQPKSSDPKALVANAKKATTEAGYAKFRMKNSGTVGGKTIDIMSGEGVYDFKNKRSRFKSSMGMEGTKIAMEVIVDDTAMYMRNTGLGEAKWKKSDLKELEKGLAALGGAGGAGGGMSQDPSSMLDILKGVGEVNPEGSDTVGGQPATRYSVTIDASKLGAEEKGADLKGAIKLWLDRKGRFLKLELDSGAAAPGDEEAGVGKMVMEMYDYDVPNKVDLPPASEVEGG